MVVHSCNTPKDTSRGSMPLKRIQHEVDKQRSLRNITNIVQSRPSLNRKKRRCNNSPPTISCLPAPDNGVYYKPKEVVYLHQQTESHKFSLNCLVKYLINKKLVPVQKTTIFRIIADSKNGKEIKDDWNIRGRTPLINDKEFDHLKKGLTLYSGKTITSKDLKQKIKDIQLGRIRSKGCVPLQICADPSRTTISNYRALLAASEGISLCTSAISKTNTRYTAENSLISSMAFLCVVASTHYDIAAEIETVVENDMKNDELPDGATKLLK